MVIVGSLAGCGSDAPSGPAPTFVRPSPERLAELEGKATPDATGETTQGADDYPRGVADFTTAAQFESYIAECEALETTAEPIASNDILFQGTKPVPLPDMPKDNILRVMEATPEFIDPNLTGESAGRFMTAATFEGLVIAAAGNAPPVAAAAESWSHTPDALTWTFKLRPGMRWSDGNPVTAHDFVYSWKRVLSPALGSKTAEQLWFLKGGKAYNTGSVATADAVGVRASDDLTLVVELEGPTPFFLDLLTYTAYQPVPRWTIEKHGDKWTEVGNIVTNGPFHLTKWIDRDRVELMKSKTYWDAQNVALDGVVVYHTDSEGKNLTLYSTGQAHLARPISQDDARRFIQEGRADMRIGSDGCIYYYVLRVDKAPFDDARVRRAFNLALEKDVLVDKVMGMHQKVATTIVPELVGGFTGYIPPRGPEYDPDKARELLIQAGYPRGSGLELEVSYNTSEGHKKIAEFAASSWGQNLGAQVTAANMEWKSLLKKQLAGDFQISRAGWCPDYPDPYTFLGTFNSAADNNYPGYKNPAYDAMLDRIRVETDRRRRNVLMCAAEKGLMRDTPVVPMYQYTRSILIRPEVKGYLPQYQDHHILKWVSLEGQGPMRSNP